MLTYLAQHREVWMQSQYRVQLLLFVREDNWDVWVLWTKINFSSVECMLWGQEPRIKAHWFCHHWCNIPHMLPDGQHPQQAGGFPDIWQRQHSLRARAEISFPTAWCPTQLLTLLMFRPAVQHKGEEKEMDILTNSLDALQDLQISKPCLRCSIEWETEILTVPYNGRKIKKI